MGSLLSRGKKAADEDHDDDGAADHKHDDALKVSPWDGASMKRTVDETVPKILTAATGLPEDASYGNGKLAIMAVATATGLVAQFYPLPFPLNRALLAVCVVIYFGLSAVLQWQASVSEREFVWASKEQPGAPAVYVRTTMAKHGDEVTFVVESPWTKQVGTATFSVGRWFTDDGRFSEGDLGADVAAAVVPLVKQAASKKGS